MKGIRNRLCYGFGLEEREHKVRLVCLALEERCADEAEYAKCQTDSGRVVQIPQFQLKRLEIPSIPELASNCLGDGAIS